MAIFDDEIVKRRWRAKATVFSPWRDFPGTYTGAEIWAMLSKGRFAAAMPAEDPPPNEATTSDTGH